MANDILYKRPGTTIPQYFVDFTEGLPSDTTLKGVTDVATPSKVTVTNSEGTDVTEDLILNQIISAMELRTDIRGGVHGEDYRLVFRAHGNTTSKPCERIVELRVRNDLGVA